MGRGSPVIGVGCPAPRGRPHPRARNREAGSLRRVRLSSIRPDLLALVVLIATTAGCSSDDGSDATTTLPPDQQTVLETAAATMGEVETVSFAIERRGAPVYIDPMGILVFEKAEGRFEAPGSADALVTVEVGGFNTEIGAIAHDGTTWLSDPITGNFAPAPGDYAFDPATLFDPSVGWRPLLAEGLSDVEWLGLDGRDRYHLRALADGDRVEVITAGLVRDQDVVLDLHLDTVTGAVREVEFSTSNDGEPSTWTLTFSGYGEPVEVSPPPTDVGD